MTLSIRTKLFLTLLLAGALVVVGVLGFVHWSFQRGLVELAQSRQQERIAAVVERLAERYRQDGGWQRLRADRRLWLALLLGQAERLHAGRGPGEGRSHTPGWLRFAAGPQGEWPPTRLPGMPGPDEAAHRSLALRLMLVDADGSPIYARPELLPGTARFPVQVDGRAVGEVALIAGPSISEGLEVRFLERQTLAILIIALAMTALSAALAFPLARRLVRPLRELQASTRRLAGGDFGARVAVGTDDELGRLGRDFNALAQTLECNEQARRRWVADISHELRTPLAVLRAEIEALQDGVRPLERAAVDALHADTLRLGRLVDDLYELAMSDLGALTYRKEPTDPAEVLARDVDAFSARFAAAGLGLRLEDRVGAPLALSADAHRLSQLFRNLLRNSLQYTDPGGGLLVRLGREADALVIDFRDTAPGVPEDALPRLFERLYRVDASRSRATGGAGLGLAICRNIVEAHGGQIRAQAAPEGGLWVQVRLPLT
ncbi:MAG: ATP-binding protein [Chromatiaceae bacterium]|nr:ATP-binding protein [Chromatiaceae bacterium]